MIDAPFCCANETIEIDLGFCKVKHVLWQRALNLRGRLLSNRDTTLDGNLFWLNTSQGYIFDSYCRHIMISIGMDDTMILDSDGLPNLERWRMITKSHLAAFFRDNAISRIRDKEMKTALRYLSRWLIHKPPGLANYLIYNRWMKREICYIFRLRSESDGCYSSLYNRHLIDSNVCVMCADGVVES